MPARKPSHHKSRPKAKHRSAARPGSTRVDLSGHIACADFIGRDQHITYGFAAQDVTRLFELFAAWTREGAQFIPTGARDEYRAEHDGASLTFHSGAVGLLARKRNPQAYLMHLMLDNRYSKWATHFIPLGAKVEVNRFDIALHWSELPSVGADADPTTHHEPVLLADITEALAEFDAFIILGAPGAGKTSTLQKIAFERAHALVNGGAGLMPLFVRLGDQHEREPLDFLRAEWTRRVGSELDEALADSGVLILADGVNELPLRDRTARLRSWRTFVEDYAPGNQIVFTSRERGQYDEQLNLPRVRVDPLDAPRIADYLERNHAEDLANLLGDSRTRLFQLAQNPFYLFLLVDAFVQGAHTLANRGKLIQGFVARLLKREDDLAPRGWLPPAVQCDALAALAFDMQHQGEAITFEAQVARAILPTAVEYEGEAVRVNPADLLRLARGATILDPNSTPDVRFFHPLLQEYFAALELLRRFEQGEELAPLWRAKRLASEMPLSEAGEWDALPEAPATGWEIATILACGLARDPVGLLESLYPLNPVLAGRCVDESGIEKPAGVVERVRADLLQDLKKPEIHLRARLQSGLTLGRIGDPRFEPELINGVKVILPPMVDVPAGEYVIGSPAEDGYADPAELPPQRISIDAFQMGRYPVTNAEFACFLAAGGYQNEKDWGTEMARRWLVGENLAGGQFESWLQVWRALQRNPNWKVQLERMGSYSPDDLETYEFIAGLSEEELRSELSSQLNEKSRVQPQYWDDAQYNNPSQPVVGITWFEARAYCAWLTEVTGKMYRLPTEAEWEAAARGTDARVYAWGNDWNSAKTNSIEGRVLKPSPVGAYDAAASSPFGTADQTGNVWDWTSTCYQGYPYANDGREDPEAEGTRVVRGGSFLNDQMNVRCAFRDWVVPDYFNLNIGFRVSSSGP